MECNHIRDIVIGVGTFICYCCRHDQVMRHLLLLDRNWPDYAATSVHFNSHFAMFPQTRYLWVSGVETRAEEARGDTGSLMTNKSAPGAVDQHGNLLGNTRSDKSSGLQESGTTFSRLFPEGIWCSVYAVDKEHNVCFTARLYFERQDDITGTSARSVAAKNGTARMAVLPHKARTTKTPKSKL